MADEKTYTEAEHIAILSDRLTKETAELSATVDQLTGDKTELENKLDVAESAKTAAEAKAAEAEKALEEFKAEIQEREEAAARKDERLKALRESAEHLGEDFFNDEKRIERIVAMKDEEFSGYAADLAATAVGAPKGATVPRESAMQNRETAGTTKSTTAAKDFLLRRYIAKEA
jgi:chromosome segregation ATPase